MKKYKLVDIENDMQIAEFDDYTIESNVGFDAMKIKPIEPETVGNYKPAGDIEKMTLLLEMQSNIVERMELCIKERTLIRKMIKDAGKND